MTIVLALGAIVLSLLCLALCWVGYGLLRQNGRLLVRVEALETAVEQLSADGESRRVFADRSLANSRINRAGLAAGTVAPAFRLPTLDGGHVTLADYAGRRLLLVFSDPTCAPCTALLPRLEIAARHCDLAVLIISRGGVDANREKLAEAGVTLPVALQAHWEISRLYGKFSTPIAYLIDERGRTVSEAACGAGPILALLSNGDPDATLAGATTHAPGSRLTH